MRKIEKHIITQYKINIKDIIPFRDLYIIVTSQGKYLLKEDNIHPGRIRFIHEAKEHLYRNGLTNIDRYLCTTKGNPYTVFEDKYQTISKLFEGRECNFENREDIKKASTLLAELHAASKGFIPSKDCLVRDELGKLSLMFQKRLRETRRMERIASRRRSKFDYIFLRFADIFYDMGKESLDYISSPLYEWLIEDTRKKGIFCHHDFTYGNILFSGEGPAVINFNYCCFDVKVYDIANLIRRRMGKCDWDIREAKIITDEYRKVKDLNPEDFYVMKLMLQFPHKFWRIGNRYYNNRRSRAERIFTEKLLEVVGEIDSHTRFLENYETII